MDSIKPFRFLSVMLLCVSLQAPGATAWAAQRLNGIDRGTRIRVTLRESEYVMMTGTFLSVEGDSSLRIDEGRGPESLSFARIGRLEQSVGKRRHTSLGAFIGLAAGLFAASIIIGDDKPGWTAGLYGPAGVTLGLVGGALIGHHSVTDEWEEVPIPRPDRDR